MLTSLLPVPVLPVRDIDRSVTFYARLGFRVRRQYPDYVILERAGVELHLRDAAAELREGENPAGLYVRVEDVDLWAAALTQEADDKPWGQREFAVSDPDGNLLRFNQPISR